MELADEDDVVEATLPDRYELDRRAVIASDGDGVMVGRVLVFASIVVVAVAMIVWRHG
ncbi:MAG: hypothetical protein ABWY07_08290 [Burkholderiales bacterium]